MSKDFFKVKKGLNIKPQDPSGLTDLQDGDIIVDSTDNNKLKQYNSQAGDFVEISGSGNGGLDVFYTQDFENIQDTSGFSTGNNATFFDGGTLQGTLALDDVSPISGDKSLSYTQASGSLNDYFASELIDIDLKQQNNDSGMTLYYQYDGNDDDLKFVVYDETKGEELTSGVELVKTTDKAQRYALSFYVPNTCNQIRWGAQVLVENIGAVLEIDDVEITSNPFVESELINMTDWESFTPVWNNLTVGNGTNEGFYRRVGDSIQIVYSLTFGSTTSISSTVSADLPNGLSPDTSKLESIVAYSYGTTFLNDSGTLANRQLGLVRVNATDIQPLRSDGVSLNSASPFTWTTGDSIRIVTTSIPIQGWTASTEHVITPAKSTLTDWEDSTVTSSWDANATTTSKIRRVGDTASFDIKVELNSTPSGVLDINLPVGLSIDVNKLTDTSTRRALLSNVTLRDNGTATYTGSIQYGNSSLLRVMFELSDNRLQQVSPTAPFSFVSGDFIVITIDNLPIAEWDSDATFLAAIPTPKTAYIKDVKPSGTAGGTFTSGAWRTRDLNTLEGDTGFVSLSNNQFTLEPGKYEIEASAPAYLTGYHKSKLRNITDSTDDIIGSNERASNGDATQTRSFIKGNITLTSSKTFEVQHYSENTRASNGFGGAGLLPLDNVFTQIKITKIQ